MPLHLHADTHAAHLQSSRTLGAKSYTPLHPQHASRALEANTSTFPGPQHGVRGTRSLVTSQDFFDEGTVEWGRRIQDLSFLKACQRIITRGFGRGNCLILHPRSRSRTHSEGNTEANMKTGTTVESSIR